MNLELTIFTLPWMAALILAVSLVLYLQSRDLLENANYYVQNVIRLLLGVASGAGSILLYAIVYSDLFVSGQSSATIGVGGLVAFFTASLTFYFLGCIIWYGRAARYFRFYGFIFFLPLLAISSLLYFLPVIVLFALPFGVIDKRCPLKKPDLFDNTGSKRQELEGHQV